MQNARYYLQQKMQPCIKEIFSHYLPLQQFKSIHDLFNDHKFHKLLMIILSEQTKNKVSDLKLSEDSDQLSYNEMRRSNFKRIFEIIEQSYDALGIVMRQRITDVEIGRMIEASDMKVLHMYMDYIFELLKHNKDVLEFITTLDEDTQNSIMQVMQNSQLTVYGDDDFPCSSDRSLSSLKVTSKLIHSDISHKNLSHLQEMQHHIQQLQNNLQMKQEEVKELKFGKEQWDEEMEEIRKEVSAKGEEIELLKKRIMSYDQIDQLMVEKDQEILKLTKKLADHELKARLRESQLAEENKHLNSRLSELQSKDLQIASKYEKQKQILEVLTRQKQESEASMKKVINNLKEKNKSIMDKVNDLQKDLIEANFEKQMKEKQLAQLKSSHHHHDDRKPLSSVLFDNIQSPRSPLRDDMNEGLADSVHGNYSKLAQQLSIDLDRADFQDEFGSVSRQQNNNKRFNQLLQQNYILKQQLQKMQSSNSMDSKQCKELQDEVHKMKKKINILKKRNDQIQNQRKEEIDVMVGVMEQCYAATACPQMAGNKK